MFTIAKNPSFTTTVSFTTPNNDAGVDQHSYTARFKYLGQKDFLALLKAAEAAKDNADDTIINRVLLGWEGVKDGANNEDLPFTDKNKAALLDVVGVRAATVTAYINAQSGAAEKN